MTGETPDMEGFRAVEERLRLQRERAPFVADYLTSGGEENPPEDLAGFVAGDGELLNKGLEESGGLIDDGIATRMGKLLGAARVINGVQSEMQRRPVPLQKYIPSNKDRFRAAKKLKYHRA